MTLEELAEASGISRQHIAALETDDEAVLSAKTITLKKIADALGLTITYVFFTPSVNQN